eukprot:352129-Chlamydomonas_euryale.AAC.3
MKRETTSSTYHAFVRSTLTHPVTPTQSHPPSRTHPVTPTQSHLPSHTYPPSHKVGVLLEVSSDPAHDAADVPLPQPRRCQTLRLNLLIFGPADAGNSQALGQESHQSGCQGIACSVATMAVTTWRNAMCTGRASSSRTGCTRPRIQICVSSTLSATFATAQRENNIQIALHADTPAWPRVELATHAQRVSRALGGPNEASDR